MKWKLAAALLTVPLAGSAIWLLMDRNHPATTPGQPAPTVASKSSKPPRDPADAPIRLPKPAPVVKPFTRSVSSPGPLPASLTEPMNSPAVREWSDAATAAIAQGNLPGAAEILRQAKAKLPPELRALAVRRTAKALAENAKNSPDTAPALLKELKDLALQQDLANGMTLELAEKKDFPTAADFVTRVADTTEGQPAAETLGREWAAEDRGAAIDWINTLESRLLQARASGGMAFNWAQEDLAGLRDWAAQIPDPAVQGQVLLKAVKIMAQDDAAGAAAWAATLPAGISRTQAVAFTAAQWASSSPQDAAAWASALPDNRDASAAILEVAGAWGNSDSAAALQWAGALPGEIRAAALNTITGTGTPPPSGQIVSPGASPDAPYTGAPRQQLDGQPVPATR